MGSGPSGRSLGSVRRCDWLLFDCCCCRCSWCWRWSAGSGRASCSCRRRASSAPTGARPTAAAAPTWPPAWNASSNRPVSLVAFRFPFRNRFSLNLIQKVKSSSYSTSASFFFLFFLSFFLSFFFFGLLLSSSSSSSVSFFLFFFFLSSFFFATPLFDLIFALTS